MCNSDSVIGIEIVSLSLEISRGIINQNDSRNRSKRKNLRIRIGIELNIISLESEMNWNRLLG